MLRVLCNLAAEIETRGIERLPLRYVYTLLEDLYAMQRAGVLKVKGGRVELTEKGWNAVRNEAEHRRQQEIARQYRTSVAQRVVVALHQLGEGWHETSEVERRAGVCNKNARFWLNKMRKDGKVEREVGNQIDPDKYRTGVHVWRWVEGMRT